MAFKCKLREVEEPVWCVCVCVSERETERERENDLKRETGRDIQGMRDSM